MEPSPTSDQILQELRELRRDLAPIIALVGQLQQIPRIAKALKNQ